MKSLHDYRKEHLAAKRRYTWAHKRAHESRYAHARAVLLGSLLTDAYLRRFRAEVIYRESRSASSFAEFFAACRSEIDAGTSEYWARFRTQGGPGGTP